MTLRTEGIIDYAVIHGSKHFPLISTHHSISISDSIVCLLIVKGWKKVSFSTQDHNSKKFHRKKTGTITLLSVVHLQLITLSLRSCISSSHCIKATLRLNNIWVQHSVNTVFLRLQPTINAKSFFHTLFSSPMFWSGVTV